jgi:hypothetical protein
MYARSSLIEQPSRKTLENQLAPERTLSICIMMILTALFSTTIVNQAQGLQSSVAVNQQLVTMNIGFELKENLTALPPLNVTLQNPTNITGPVEAAVRRQVPGATLQSLQLQAKTTLLSPATGLWLLQEDYTIVVAGASSNTGAMIKTNLSFLSMNASDPMKTGSSELNDIGREYLLQPLKNIPANPTTGYLLNGAVFTNTAIPAINTNNFRLLDFTWIPPIAQWTRTDDTINRTTKWDLNNKTSNIFQGGAPFNLTVGLSKHENTYFPIYQAVLDPSIEVGVSAIAWAQGTFVYFDVPSNADTVMPGIITVSLAILVLTLSVDRRLTRQVIAKRKKK